MTKKCYCYCPTRRGRDRDTYDEFRSPPLARPSCKGKMHLPLSLHRSARPPAPFPTPSMPRLRCGGYVLTWSTGPTVGASLTSVELAHSLACVVVASWRVGKLQRSNLWALSASVIMVMLCAVGKSWAGGLFDFDGDARGIQYFCT